MTTFKSLWRWLKAPYHSRVLFLKLDPLNARYLQQIAAKTGFSRQQIAQDLLNNALLDRQVSEAHLTHWQALTPRQQQVAALTCLNFTNRQIAARLSISPQTVNKFCHPGTMGVKIRLSTHPQLTMVQLLSKLVSPGNFRSARLEIPRKMEFVQYLRTSFANKFNFNHSYVSTVCSRQEFE